ncbi:MAG: aspartyl/asparaginyl beta-hydroxylase domain-containing protein [Arenimonas sp.]
MTAIVEALLNQARQYVQNNDARAEKAFAVVLENDTFNVEARTFLARVAMQNGKPQSAFEHLEIATRAKPANPMLWRSLAITHVALEQWPQAQEAFEKCLKLAPKMHAARLHLGKTLERQGRQHDAIKTYLDALSQAQRDGLWLDEATTPPQLREDIRHATQVANSGRLEIYGILMRPLIERFGEDDMQRVNLCVRGVLGFENLTNGPAKQKPTFMYFPGLPETPVFERNLFPWFEQLESSYEKIRLEAEAVLLHQNALTPFLSLGEADKASDYLGGEQPNWNAHFFYRHGKPILESQNTCPNTSAILEKLPLVRIADHAPEICFSMLTADTHILPHYGTSNIRSVVHFPLIIPEHCALKVSDQIIEGKAGECFAFDDTFLHEAWNRSNENRTILLMDTWNPHLRPEERVAMTTIIEAIGHFNQTSS